MYVKEDVDSKARGAAEFADFFAAAWAVGATDPERFFGQITSRLAPDAPMIQPLARTVRGERGLRELFEPLFEVIPDLRGRVVRWGETDDGVIIELALAGTLGSRPVRWTTLDRITLRDGLIAEREAHFDPLPLVKALARSPRSARRLLPGLLRRGGRA
jgi:ketosteroid isomerase-like protein